MEGGGGGVLDSGTSCSRKVLYSSSADVWKVSVNWKLQVEMRTPPTGGAGLGRDLLGVELACRSVPQRSVATDLQRRSCWDSLGLPHLDSAVGP